MCVYIFTSSRVSDCNTLQIRKTQTYSMCWKMRFLMLLMFSNHCGNILGNPFFYEILRDNCFSPTKDGMLDSTFRFSQYRFLNGKNWTSIHIEFQNPFISLFYRTLEKRIFVFHRKKLSFRREDFLKWNHFFVCLFYENEMRYWFRWEQHAVERFLVVSEQRIV